MRSLLLIIMLAMFVLGCNHKVGPGTTRDYILLLNIKDALGEEKLRNIPLDELDNFPGALEMGHGYVSPEAYKLTVVMPDMCAKYAESSDKNRYSPKLWVVEIEQHLYILLMDRSPLRCPAVETITYKLFCPYIFGDDREHIIVSSWRPNSLAISDNTCFHITLDGNVLPVTQGKLPNSTKDLSIAWVVLGRLSCTVPLPPNYKQNFLLNE